MKQDGQLLVVDDSHLAHFVAVASAVGFDCETVSDNGGAESLFERHVREGAPLDLVHLDMTRVRGMRGMQLLEWLRKQPEDQLLPGGQRLRSVPVVVHSPTMGPNSWKSLRRIDKQVPCVSDPMEPGALLRTWAETLRNRAESLAAELLEAQDGEAIATPSFAGTREEFEGLVSRLAALAAQLESGLK